MIFSFYWRFSDPGAVLLGKVPMAVRQKPLSGWTTIILLKVLLENFLETIRVPMLLKSEARVAKQSCRSNLSIGLMSMIGVVFVIVAVFAGFILAEFLRRAG